MSIRSVFAHTKYFVGKNNESVYSTRIYVNRDLVAVIDCHDDGDWVHDEYAVLEILRSIGVVPENVSPFMSARSAVYEVGADYYYAQEESTLTNVRVWGSPRSELESGSVSSVTCGDVVFRGRMV